MNNTVFIGLIAFAAILAGAFAGVEVRERLPKHHLTDETKSLVSVSTAVVATVSALVLGLLISNANTTFTRLGGEVTGLSAQILRLDQILRRYGSAADPGPGGAGPKHRKKKCDSVPRRCRKYRSRRFDDVRTTPAARRYAAGPETSNPTRPLVAGAGYDTRRKD